MIITTTFTDLTYKSLTGRTDVQILSCPHLSDPSVLGSILRKHLSLPYKELPASVLLRVARKKQCHIPVFLSLIGTELRTCGVLREKEEEMELMKGYMEADSIPELWVKVIHRWVQDYSRTAPTEDITSCKVTEAQTSTASLRDGKSFLFCYMLAMILLDTSNKHFLYRSLRLGVGHALSYSCVSCWADWASGFGFAGRIRLLWSFESPGFGMGSTALCFLALGSGENQWSSDHHASIPQPGY